MEPVRAGLDAPKRRILVVDQQPGWHDPPRLRRAAPGPTGRPTALSDGLPRSSPGPGEDRARPPSAAHAEAPLARCERGFCIWTVIFSTADMPPSIRGDRRLGFARA